MHIAFATVQFVWKEGQCALCIQVVVQAVMHDEDVYPELEVPFVLTFETVRA